MRNSGRFGAGEPGGQRKKVAARAAPDDPRTAASAFSDLWSSREDIDLQAPEDAPAEDVAPLDAHSNSRFTPDC